MSGASVLHDPTGLVRLPATSVRVEDPEEEIFLLYTRLSTKGAQDGTHAFTGLGSVDSKQDALTVCFDLPHKELHDQTSSKRHGKKAISKHATENRTLEIELLQDKTALRSKKGDTGSVLWRVSVALGQTLLRELCSNSPTSLFNLDRLKEGSVLELGAGTGLLSLVLAPWVRHYTATDLDYLVPLIRKNIAANLLSVQHTFSPQHHHTAPKHRMALKRSATASTSTAESAVTVEALDWLALHRTAAHARTTLFRLAHADPPDLIVAVDCVYNPTLLAAFLGVLEHYAQPGRTLVLVAVELRSEEVVREFLELWVRLGWEIWRIGGESDSGSWLGVSFAAWVGWKVVVDLDAL